MKIKRIEHVGVVVKDTAASRRLWEDCFGIKLEAEEANAIRKLALPYRQVITLVLEDLSYPEIAEALGISTVNVGVRVNRAKQQLKVLLDER